MLIFRGVCFLRLFSSAQKKHLHQPPLLEALSAPRSSSQLNANFEPPRQVRMVGSSREKSLQGL